MYGDFTIASVPTNAKDALTALPEVYSALKNAGVPIFVTLQPIPSDVKSKASLIHSLDAQQITDLLSAYSSLEDLNNRFIVLENSVERYQDLVPHLAGAVADARNAFSTSRVAKIQSLKTLLTTVASRTSSSTDDKDGKTNTDGKDDKDGKAATAATDDKDGKTDTDATDGKDDDNAADDASTDTTDEDAVETLLTAVNDLLSEHELQDDDSNITPPQYPTSLGGLEEAFARFEALNYVLKAHEASLTALTSLSGKLSIASQAMVFLSWSVNATARANLSNLMTTGLGLYKQNFICYFAYTEGVSEVNDVNLPSGSSIDTSSTDYVALSRFTVDKDKLAWKSISWDDMKTDSTSAAYTSQDSKKIYVMPIKSIEISSVT
jgi:hypothetical protein